jgi:hypothetical protein
MWGYVLWIVVDEAALHLYLTTGNAKLPPPIPSERSDNTFSNPPKLFQPTIRTPAKPPQTTNIALGTRPT